MLRLKPAIQWIDDPRDMSRSDIISIFHCLSLKNSCYSEILSFLVAGKCLLIPDDKCEHLIVDCGEYKIIFSGNCPEGDGLRLTVFKCEGRKVPSYFNTNKKVLVTNWAPFSWFEEYSDYKVKPKKDDCDCEVSLPDSEDEEDNFVFLVERFLKRSFLVDKAGIQMEKEFCNEIDL